MSNGNARMAIVAVACSVVFGLGGVVIGTERTQARVAQEYETKVSHRDDMRELRNDIRELRNDVKEILRRLPPS